MTTSPENNRTETRLELEETVFIEVLSSGSPSASNVVMCTSLDFLPTAFK